MYCKVGSYCAEQATQKAEQSAQQAKRKSQRAETLAAKLRELGVAPDKYQVEFSLDVTLMYGVLRVSDKRLLLNFFYG